MIHVNELYFRYPDSTEDAIQGINFNIEKGEIFGFLGPSGAGKSTTQKVLIKLLRNFTGGVRVFNKSINTWNTDYYNKIGVGFELPNHYLKLTARENLNFFAAFYKGVLKTPEELLDLVDLGNDIDNLVGNYSKGMKMRLNFVRALMHDPEIYFFDEPTSGLDPVNARRIKDIIVDLKSKGKTIFLTTHNMYDADELCDRVAFIVNGKLTVIDTPKNLKLQNGQRTVLIEFGNQTIESKEFDLDTIQHNNEFISTIQNEHIISIHSKEATLDDVFIKTTGVNL